MLDAAIDLEALVGKLAKRKPDRTEATVQSQLHALLLVAPLQLEERHLEDIVLEQPARKRRRIDVEVGQCVFEVKRDLRKGKVRPDAEVQLAGYVVDRTEQTGQRYVGVLTDGHEWSLYRLRNERLEHVSSHTVTPDRPDIDALCVWLEGVLSTGEQVAPTPTEISRLLGANSPGYMLDIAELSDLYQAGKKIRAVQLKRQLWAKLLTTAQGTAFQDDDLLFIQHTLLVVSAEVIAHAVLDVDPTQVPPTSVVSGQLFRQAKVLGVVEADFFDWVVEVPDGDRFVRGLMKRLARFAWANVEHDILKVLYESVIPAEQRKQLGEYYTPDWLAQHVVEETVKSPLKQRVLDPSCGSGTFVFHAVKHYLEAADQAEIDNATAVSGVCSNVMGMDLHPVAVTLARVTYLLAIGSERLTAERGPISIPVFLGDSLQWGQEETLQTSGALVINADEDFGLFDNELRFPDSLLTDAGTFDSLVSELSEMASERKPGSPVPSLDQLHHRFAMPSEDLETVRATFRTMCELSDQGRDHIWGYYVRNLARPRWLARKENRVDILVGNPPWLSYRYMTRPMQSEFQELCKDRGLWKGTKSATHVDLSALFVMRCIERYLTQKGSFAFVLPFATLSRQHFEGFRNGKWPRPDGFPVAVKYLTAWDFHAVKPTFFEVPCCVARGRRTTERSARAIPEKVDRWTGRLPSVSVDWPTAKEHLSRKKASVKAARTSEPASPYAKRFYQGATLVPRMLCFVDKLPSGPLGRVSGEIAVRSQRTNLEKRPWKDLPSLEYTVESNFVLPVHLGATILPYRPCRPLDAVIPWDGKRLLHSGDEHLSRYPGLSKWWHKAEETWNQNRSNDRLTLIENLNYMRKLTKQFWRATGMCPPIRVVYTKSGMYVASAVVEDPTIVIDHKLYWATCRSREEAQYLTAVLNSEAVTLGIRDYQARGEHNPRDIDKYIWQLAIPEYEPGNKLHQRLASLAKEAEREVASLDLPKTRFEKQRAFIRDTFGPTKIGKSIETAVRKLIKLK